MRQARVLQRAGGRRDVLEDGSHLPGMCIAVVRLLRFKKLVKHGLDQTCKDVPTHRPETSIEPANGSERKRGAITACEDATYRYRCSCAVCSMTYAASIVVCHPIDQVPLGCCDGLRAHDHRT